MKVLPPMSIKEKANSMCILYVESNRDGTVGGSHMSLLHLVTGMRALGLTLVAVFGSSHSAMHRFDQLGIKTIVLPTRTPLRTRFTVIRPFVRALNFFLSQLLRVRSIVRSCSIIRREKIQLVHTNNSIYDYDWLIAAKIMRVPCVAHQRGLATRQPVARFLARYFDAVICISNAVKNDLIGHGVGPHNLRMIHNGLDVGAYRPLRGVDDVRREFGIREEQPIVGIVGNIQRWKGQDVVIRAVACVRQKFPDLICLIVGDVSQVHSDDVAFHASILSSIEKYGLEKNVILTGFRTDVATYMNAMAVVIHASVEPEPFGRVLLEAMALSKPVIATRAGGVPEIVDDGVTGLLYEAGNSVELAGLIERLLARDELRATMGNAAYARVSTEFDIRSNNALTFELYATIVAARR